MVLQHTHQSSRAAKKQIFWTVGVLLAVIAGLAQMIEPLALQVHQPPPSLHAHSGSVTAIVWSPDGRSIASTGTSDSNKYEIRSVQISDALTGENISTHLSGSDVQGMAWSTDGSRIAFWGGDGTWQTWEDPKTGGGVKNYDNGSRDRVSMLIWSPQVHISYNPVLELVFPIALVRSRSKNIEVWDASGGLLMTLDYNRCLKEHNNVVITSNVPIIAWSPDGNYIASTISNGTVCLWSIDWSKNNNYTVKPYAVHKGKINQLVWTSKGNSIVLKENNDSNNLMQTLDITKRTVSISTYKLPKDIAPPLAWSPDGKYFAAARGHAVEVWDAIKNRLILTYHGHFNDVTALAWSPNGEYIASGSEDATLQVWDALTGEHISTYGSVKQDSTSQMFKLSRQALEMNRRQYYWTPFQTRSKLIA